jgi:hypothetical protein
VLHTAHFDYGRHIIGSLDEKLFARQPPAGKVSQIAKVYGMVTGQVSTLTPVIAYIAVIAFPIRRPG